LSPVRVFVIQSSVDALLPLPLPVFHMLLGLSEGERHGYALKREILQRTGGKLNLGSGALYGSINSTRKPMRELQIGVKFVF